MLLALGVGGYLYLQLDDEIRRFAEATIAKQYPDMAVSVGSAGYAPGRGVSLFDIRVACRGDESAAEPVLTISELRLIGEFDLRRLAAGTHRLNRIEVRRPALRAVRDASGVWNCQSLWPPPDTGGTPPPITIANATLVVSDLAPPSSVARRPLTVRNINIDIKPTEPAAGQSAGQSAGQPAGQPGTGLTILGSVEGALAKSFRLEGRVSPNKDTLEISVDAEQLHVTD
ncbi:MAG: hypothetical protein AAGG46_04585, partial [Planctomycetota bacterium]